jgi:putative SOS response-associated peptidase YedK
MCYAYKPVRLASGAYHMLAGGDLRRALRDGTIEEGPGGYYYAKDTVEVVLSGGEVRPMRWDLIPPGFLKPAPYTVAEGIKKKNSRAKNPETGKKWGFDSYNARIETVATTWSFKSAWKQGRRGVLPVVAWKERPNMDEAPAEFKGKEYAVYLPEPMFLPALWETWTGTDGGIESCTVITGPSDAIPELRGIWHERTPIVLTPESAEVWLDPALPAEAAMSLLRGVTSPPLLVREIVRSPKTAA